MVLMSNQAEELSLVLQFGNLQLGKISTLALCVGSLQSGDIRQQRRDANDSLRGLRQTWSCDHWCRSVPFSFVHNLYLLCNVLSFPISLTATQWANNERLSSRMLIWMRRCNKTLSTLPRKHYRNIIMKRCVSQSVGRTNARNGNISDSFALLFPVSGRGGIHQEGIRPQVQPNVARDCGAQLWQLCYARNQAFYLLLSWASSRALVQEWIVARELVDDNLWTSISEGLTFRANTAYCDLASAIDYSTNLQTSTKTLGKTIVVDGVSFEGGFSHQCGYLVEWRLGFVSLQKLHCSIRLFDIGFPGLLYIHQEQLMRDRQRESDMVPQLSALTPGNERKTHPLLMRLR